MATPAYEDFRQRLLDRHEHPATAVLSTVGDALPLLGLAAAVTRRDRRWAVHGLWAGLATASIAHLFQPGTLFEEYGAVLRHPRWAARAEAERIRGGRRTEVLSAH